ncbi:DsbC family protein [Hydrogenophaga sp.]|uniref:DsbC family protein n=1 Tax=Hydrogenophaga sp. TaxID=1904254 RepID=UPI0025C68FE2|nr:DsbC family protein [Hydrogenophaga sp.]MBT9463054.1 DsbC family protein [Hydrogenophaga sp.]
MNFSSFHCRTRWAALCGAALACASLLMAAPATAQTVAPDTQALSAIVERLVGAKVESIAPSPVAGLFEVIVKGNILYIDSTGTHLVDGQVLEVATRTSVTARRKQEHEIATTPVMDIAQLNLADAIKTVKGREMPGRVLVTFEDPRCGFCKRLHQTLSDVPDLVLYTFPVSFLGPQSRAMNEAIWCASDRSKAWNDVMRDIPPSLDGSKCDLHALDRNSELASKYRVAGTPTLFTAGGVRIDGAVGAPAIEQALNASVR